MDSKTRRVHYFIWTATEQTSTSWSDHWCSGTHYLSGLLAQIGPWDRQKERHWIRRFSKSTIWGSIALSISRRALPVRRLFLFFWNFIYIFTRTLCMRKPFCKHATFSQQTNFRPSSFVKTPASPQRRQQSMNSTGYSKEMLMQHLKK